MVVAIKPPPTPCLLRLLSSWLSRWSSSRTFPGRSCWKIIVVGWKEAWRTDFSVPGWVFVLAGPCWDWGKIYVSTFRPWYFGTGTKVTDINYPQARLTCWLPWVEKGEPSSLSWELLFDIVLLMYWLLSLLSEGCHYETASNLCCMLPMKTKVTPVGWTCFGLHNYWWDIKMFWLMWMCWLLSKGCHYETASNLCCMLPLKTKVTPVGWTCFGLHNCWWDIKMYRMMWMCWELSLLFKGCHYETANNLCCLLPVNKESDPHLSKRYAHLFKLLRLKIVNLVRNCFWLCLEIKIPNCEHLYLKMN